MSCRQNADYKSIRDEVVTIHDEVMLDAELAYKNKRKLDTLAENLDSLVKHYPGMDIIREKDTIAQLQNKLSKADDLMNDWMHQFEADKGNKSDEQAASYFTNEKLKISSIDSTYANLIKLSDAFLLKFKQ
ncbi:hypothetical protein [Desertivirga xinjiangensis]|uniref:hypothetical protein n=1 Tax=Desertivirga xinjiangensis TaxID=539206 RepID=UPI00210CE3A1|nr:hypothetical protein [Pedobacter xinjiangensis]